MSDIRWEQVFADETAVVLHGHYQGELVVSVRDDANESYANYTFTNFAAPLGEGVIRTDKVGEIEPLPVKEAIERIFDHFAHRTVGRPTEPYMGFHDETRNINWEIWNID